MAVPWSERAASALAAGGLAAWLIGQEVVRSSLAAATVGLVVGIAVSALPRIGWIIAALAGSGVLALAGDTGAAMILAPALLIPVALLPLRPRRWPLAAVAPALGALGLAGAWPALAARAPSLWQRAVLGATGWVWLLLAAPFVGRPLYAGLPHSIPAPAIWTPSADEAARHVITPLLGSAIVGPALVWAVGAMILPTFTASRPLRPRIMLAIAWSLVVVLGTVSMLALAHAPGGIGFGQASLGAVGCALLAVLR